MAAAEAEARAQAAQTARQGVSVALERAMEAETRAVESINKSDDVAARAVRYADKLWAAATGRCCS